MSDKDLEDLPSTAWLEQAALDDTFLVFREEGSRRFRVTVEETTRENGDGDE